MREPAGGSSSGGARIAALPAIGMVTLRGDLASDALRRAVRELAGHDLPATRRIAGSSENGVAWMSPDELLIFCDHPRAPDLAAELGRALGDMHHLAADTSDARSVFRIEGPSAREVLAKGAPVDLSPGAFGPGDLRRTRLGQVPAAFWMTGPETFELVCFRSLAGFVADWLATAAAPGSFPGFLRG